MGAYRNIYTDRYADTELEMLREENELLREQVEMLEEKAEQYLTALLIRAIKEPLQEVAND
jgi:hypothetical protein